MIRLCLFALLGIAAWADAPRIFYSKSFPGSVPAYMSIEINQDGTSVYKEAVDDNYPMKFQLDPDDSADIFRLAEKLDRFTREIESGLNVAKMGVKTFRWLDGAKQNEVHFNYSTDLDAKALADWFEKIAETEQTFIRLERTVKYDKLGVNNSLLIFEATWDRKRLVAPEQFLPLLDRVAKNDTYLHMARERAARMGDTIRARKTASSKVE